MKKVFLICLMVFSFGCQEGQAKTFKGVLFIGIVDDFESGTSRDTFQFKLSESKEMKTLVFEGGKPPKTFWSIQPGREVEIKGELQDDGSILYQGKSDTL